MTDPKTNSTEVTVPALVVHAGKNIAEALKGLQRVDESMLTTNTPPLPVGVRYEDPPEYRITANATRDTDTSASTTSATSAGLAADPEMEAEQPAFWVKLSNLTASQVRAVRGHVESLTGNPSTAFSFGYVDPISFTPVDYEEPVPAEDLAADVAAGGEWTIDYFNDTGSDDSAFNEWWEVSNSTHSFRCHTSAGAELLKATLTTYPALLATSTANANASAPTSTSPAPRAEQEAAEPGVKDAP